MATLNISMPDEMRAFIETRISTGEYQSASDYLRDLIRHDREETERLLVEGLDSATARPLDMAALRIGAQSLRKQKKLKSSRTAREMSPEALKKFHPFKRFPEQGLSSAARQETAKKLLKVLPRF